jgi:hypothetical protein
MEKLGTFLPHGLNVKHGFDPDTVDRTDLKLRVWIWLNWFNFTNPHKKRAITMVVEFFTFCCLTNYQLLQEKHFRDMGEDLLVTFPSDDQFHNGQTTLLKRNSLVFVQS